MLYIDDESDCTRCITFESSTGPQVTTTSTVLTLVYRDQLALATRIRNFYRGGITVRQFSPHLPSGPHSPSPSPTIPHSAP